MLALRTTVKPDVGASPSELVYGEGITVPGQLLGPPDLTDDELLRAQRATRANLRMEVERLQPKPTSHHRTPAVHIPDELATATHVLVRKGLQPSLTAPYEGPFRVISRHPNGFRLEFPGRNSDIVALARLKPAIVAPEEERDEEDQNDVTPPSPPPPGRPPGLRTRQPAPTSRQTRSSTQQQQQQQQRQQQQPRQQQQQQRSTTTDEPNDGSHSSQLPCSSRDVPGEPLPVSPPPLPPRRSRRQREPSPELVDPTGRVDIPDDPNIASAPGLVAEQTLADAFPHLPDPLSRDPRDLDQPLVPPAPPAPPTTPPPDGTDQGGARRQRVLSFSKPKKGNFSFRRRKPDVSFLHQLISDL